MLRHQITQPEQKNEVGTYCNVFVRATYRVATFLFASVGPISPPPSLSHLPPRHAGDPREVFGLVSLIIEPKISFNSRIAILHVFSGCRAHPSIQRSGVGVILSGFVGVASSTHVVVRETGVSPNIPYLYIIFGSSGWASVMVRPWKSGNTSKQVICPFSYR